MDRMRYTVRRVFNGIWRCMRRRPRVFVAIVLAVFLLNLVLPWTVLSVARKPWDLFSFNPWLRHLPEWLQSNEAGPGEKLAFVYNLALYWFIADGPSDAPEWGYTATVRDILRFLFIALMFGAYFALWMERREQLRANAWSHRFRARGGVAGILLSTIGFSTMPCSVVGCGAPVLPVLGLMLTGLTSGTLALIQQVSSVLTATVLLCVIAAVVSLSWVTNDFPSS